MYKDKKRVWMKKKRSFLDILVDHIPSWRTIEFSSFEIAFLILLVIVLGGTLASALTWQKDGVTTLTLDDVGNLVAVGNMTADYFIGNGSLLTDINSVEWNRSGTNVFLSNTGDSVGIGTTSPQETLHVNGSGATRVEVESTTSVAAFKATNAQGSYAWYVDSTADKFHLYDFTDNLERISLDGAGSVGIGTVSPESLGTGTITLSRILHLKGNATESGRLVIESGSSSGNAGFVLWDGSAGTNQKGMFLLTSEGLTSFLSLNDDLSTNTSNILVFDHDTGNVGINTTTPTHTLTVVGTINASSFIGDASGLTGVSAGGWADDGTVVRLDSITDQVGIGTTSPSYKLHVNGNVSLNSTLFVTEEGRVGIGTASPGYELEVVDTGSRSQVVANRSDGKSVELFGALNYAGVMTIGQSELHFGTNQVEQMMIQNGTGNVGIGTTSPSYKLHVNGNVSLNSTLFVTEAGRVGIGTSTPGTALEVRNTSSTQGILYLSRSSWPAGTNGSLDFVSGSTPIGRMNMFIEDNSNTALTFSTYRSGTLTEAIRIKANGNVGIGTTSPVSPLEVSGDTNTAIRVTDSDDNVQLKVQASGGGTVIFGSVTNHPVQFVTANSNTIMHLDNTTNNVGIGTTSPQELLHIASAADNANAMIVGDVSKNATLFFLEDFNQGTATKYGGYIRNDGSASSTTMFLGTVNADTETDTLVLQSGNVGIGDDSPSFGKLEVRETTESSTGGIGITNIAQGNLLTMWVDSSKREGLMLEQQDLAH